MGEFELVRFREAEELAQAAAADWFKALASPANLDRPQLVALSGGRIAARFFDSAAAIGRAQAALLKKVHFFWGDERCVPPQDPESNYRLAREHLFIPLGIADGQTHRIRGEEPPQVAAKEAEAELRRHAHQSDDRQPVLDLVFLGLGEEGHVASLFPGEALETVESGAVYRAVTASKPPPHRITLGYPALAAAREIWVLASGPGKQEALQRSLTPGAATPLARVLRLRAHTRIFTDIALG